jgi:hypothetical protein
MGLTLQPNDVIFLDTSCFIYFFEQHPVFFPAMKHCFDQVAAKECGFNNAENFALTPNPSPKLGEGSKSPVPLLPSWEKGLGDEGRPKHGISEVI